MNPESIPTPQPPLNTQIPTAPMPQPASMDGNQSSGNNKNLIAFILSLLFFIPLLPIVAFVMAYKALKNHTPRRKLGIAALVISVLVFAFQAYFIYLVWGASKTELNIHNQLSQNDSADQARELKAVNNGKVFLQKLKTGDYSGAIQLTAPSFKEYTSSTIASDLKDVVTIDPVEAWRGSADGKTQRVSYAGFRVAGTSSSGQYMAIFVNTDGKIIWVSTDFTNMAEGDAAFLDFEQTAQSNAETL